MKLMVAHPKEKKEFTLAKLKVYNRGNINLPKSFLEVLGIDYKNGGEIIAEANPLKGEVILRKKSNIGNLPTTNLQGFEMSEPYLLRGALREAEEFFKELAEGIKKVYPEAPVEVGTLENGVVYLKLGPRNVFEEIHLSYWETPYKPKGVITLDGGVPNKTESGYEITPQIEENLKLIKQVVNGKVIGKSGVELIETPKFSNSEAMQLGLIVDRVLRKVILNSLIEGV